MVEQATGAEGGDQLGTRLLFENDRVRVWDFALAPGETLNAHTHRLDYIIIVTSGGLLRVPDETSPAGYRDVQFPEEAVSFREVGDGKHDPPHTNVGEKPHRNFVVELKR